MVADDFGPSTGTSKTAKRALGDSKGAKRSWLKVYETLPPQMLNAYGPAKFAKMSDSEYGVTWQPSEKWWHVYDRDGL